MSRRCLVFGGSGALGSAVCRALEERGARVASPGRAQSLDLSSVAAIERTIDEVAAEWGGIDAFVHCAGIGAAWPKMTEVTESDWDAMLAVNARSAFFAVRRLSTVMDGGNVLLVGCLEAAKLVPSPVHYAASKGALRGMVQAMAKELGGRGIRVNLIAPGTLEGGMSRALPEDLRRAYLKHCGMRRVGRFSEVAEVVAWFALENTYVTGQTVVLDGGL
ncbi:MAG: SDR family oxidoreductase [Planctomycetes bacterium]|nr:SDR family oxidoreductase [Planctomycetota bacterium]